MYEIDNEIDYFYLFFFKINLILFCIKIIYNNMILKYFIDWMEFGIFY